MWIESKYLIRQLEAMRKSIDKQDTDKESVTHYAFNMCRSSIECIENTILALERHPLGHFEMYHDKEQTE